MRASRIAAFAVVAFLCLSAEADQALWITEAQSKAAVEKLQPLSVVRQYCQPCGDEVWRTRYFYSVDATPVEGESYWEVRLDEEAVDLAYVYFEEDGQWKNLAHALGIEVSGVDTVLDPWALGEVYDFAPVLLRGTIGGLPIIMQLQRDYESESLGYYFYAKSGTPITLSGAIDDMGRFELDELAGEQVTGKLTGQLRADFLAVRGFWSSPDGSKQLPLQAERIAKHFNSNTYGGVTDAYGDASAAQPLLTDTERLPWYSAANHAIFKELGEIRERFVADLLDIAPNPPPMPMAGEEGGGYTLDATDYRVGWVSDIFFSAVFTIYEYTGGAHGNTSFLAVNLKAGPENSAVPVTLEDVVTGDPYALLGPIVLQDLKAQEAQWVVDGTVAALGKDELSTYLITPAGIEFHFAPYAMGPYAQGSFVSTVAWKALEGKLKDGMPGAILGSGAGG